MRDVASTGARIRNSAMWFAVVPLMISFALADRLPLPFQGEKFNRGVPQHLQNAENISRIASFALPFFITIGFSRTRQKVGIVIYVAGVLLYLMSYLLLIWAPQSEWSASRWGFCTAAYINIVWMVGLAFCGESFLWRKGLRFRPSIYLIASLTFLAFHVTHTWIAYTINR
jgi:hypothetical protein